MKKKHDFWPLVRFRSGGKALGDSIETLFLYFVASLSPTEVHGKQTDQLDAFRKNSGENRQRAERDVKNPSDDVKHEAGLNSEALHYRPPSLEVFPRRLVLLHLLLLPLRVPQNVISSY